ncbi:MAG: hypothetical protein IJD90_00735, partial [Clostridia bacterium]|nr:hypothetical protein [Clostridia bacterium]
MFKKFGAALVSIVMFIAVVNLPASAQENVEKQINLAVADVVISKRVENPKIRTIKTIAIDTAKITWKKVKDADGYNVYRKASNAKNFKKIATVEDKTFIKDKGLMCGFKYDYKVNAFSDDSETTLVSNSENNTKTFAIPVSACKTFEIKRKDYCFPLKVQKVDVTSAYGWRFGGGDFHDGIDLDVKTGDDVLSWKSGYVYEIKRAYESSWGNFV